MALSHNYHPNCGCYSCCQQESVDEQADELAVNLSRSGNVLSETLGEFSMEQFSTIAKLLADNDDLAAAEQLRKAVDRYINDRIETQMADTGYSRMEAVTHLLGVYEVKARRPAPALVKPWEEAA